jgi:hypothetical protein
MTYEERRQPGDGTFAAAFSCPTCRRRIAMLANPMETQLVSSLGVQIGGRVLDEQPMELVRTTIDGRPDAFADDGAVHARDGVAVQARPVWSAGAVERLSRVPAFVRGMVKRIYTDYAVERSITDITPDVMDRARTDLGLEEM